VGAGGAAEPKEIGPLPDFAPTPQRPGLVRQPIQVQFLRQTPQNLAKLIRQIRC
jgi:hypothetical protein